MFGRTFAEVLLLIVSAVCFLAMAVTSKTMIHLALVAPMHSLCMLYIHSMHSHTMYPRHSPEPRTNPRLLTLSSPCRLGCEGYCEPDTLPYVMGYPTVPRPIQRDISLCVTVVELCVSVYYTRGIERFT
jgi:hypothetical protein